MKLISWNVNGIRAVQKKGFIDIVKDLDADVFCVQETKAHSSQLDDELLNIEGYQSYWHSAEKKGYSSVAVYTRQEPVNVIEGIGLPEFDCEGRVQICEYADFVLFNCYFPNAQHGLPRIDYKIDFNNALIDRLNDFDKTRIICGDFNVAHKAIDLKNPKTNTMNPGFSQPERDWMDKFIDDEGYIDSFRKFNQDPEEYSWWSYRFNARARNIGWRLDYFCVDGKSDDRIKDAGIMQDVMGSDHCPVWMELG